MLIRFAMQEFISEKEFENLSQNTISSYQLLFKDFLNWCESNGYEHISQLSSRTIKRYLAICKTEKGNNPTSINTKRKQFRAFFNFLIQEGIIEENPTDQIKRVKEDIRIKTFTDEEINAILSYLRRTRRRNDTFYAVRNHTIFLTLIGTGIRAGELTSLKWNGINLEARSMKVFGKSRRDETVPLTRELIKELAYWKTYCTKHFSNPLEYVFVTRKGERLTTNGLQCWFKRLSQKMGFPETRCSPHSCRHYFAKKWIQNGGDISTLARVLRHTSIKTTEKYLQFWGNEVAEDNDRFNPLSSAKF